MEIKSKIAKAMAEENYGASWEACQQSSAECFDDFLEGARYENKRLVGAWLPIIQEMAELVDRMSKYGGAYSTKEDVDILADGLWLKLHELIEKRNK